jgi:dihydropteroate synthase
VRTGSTAPAPGAGSTGSVGPVHAATLRLGSRDVDIGARPLVMGVLDVVPPDTAAEPSLDDLLRRAGRLVDHGADLLDLELTGGGGDVESDREVEAVARAVGAVAGRFDVPLSVATSWPAVAGAACAAGAEMANDRSGCTGADYLATVAACGATLVVGHAGPVEAGPGDVVDAVLTVLVERVDRARATGIAPDRIVLDGGLGQGKSPRQALAMLRASARFAGLGHPVLLSFDDATWAGVVPGAGEGPGPGAASLAATSLGTALGCRIVRTRDVAAHHQVCAVMAAIHRAAR